MSGFYVSLIFVGIMLVAISLVLVLLDKKNVFVFRKNIEEKQQELVEIINDAEQMIDELNRFSDYIVNQMDLKSDELNRNIMAAEKRISDLNQKANSVLDSKASEPIKSMSESSRSEQPAKETQVLMEPEMSEMAERLEAAGIAAPAALNTAVSAAAAYNRSNVKAAQSRKREKIIPFNNKYTEVLRLSKEGMEELEIAKNLNMGKGEVELIIGLRR